jgi:hypothetical protein
MNGARSLEGVQSTVDVVSVSAAVAASRLLAVDA